MISNWFPTKYSEIAKQQFILSHCFEKVVDGAPYLQFFQFNPFKKSYWLQINWSSAPVSITKSTLISETRITLESGTLGLTEGEKLLRSIQKLNFSMLDLKAPEANARDGSIFELCIGLNDAKLNFKWWNADTPEAWTQLNELAASILKLEAETEYSEKIILAYSIEKEAKFSTFENSKSMFISYKELDE